MPELHGKRIRRILIVKPSSLGDIMHTYPAMLLLRQRFPKAKLDWLVHPSFADALPYSPFRCAPGSISTAGNFPG